MVRVAKLNDYKDYDSVIQSNAFILFKNAHCLQLALILQQSLDHLIYSLASQPP